MAIPAGEFSFALLQYTAAEDIKTDQLMFVFDGGIMNDERQSAIRLNPPELKSFRFVDMPTATKLLKPSMAVRIARSLEAIREGRAAYDEIGTGPKSVLSKCHQ